MLGLLEAYGSDESGSESDKEDASPKESSPTSRLPNPFELPPPNLDGSSTDTLEKSVFLNPYVAADNAKQALLEKHVKMISTDVRTVNGKNICWNYRKKKCRFGHKCKYAHDSDLQTTTPPLSTGLAVTKFHQPKTKELEIVQETSPLARGKKRPGLCDTLTPGAKIMKKYYAEKR